MSTNLDILIPAFEYRTGVHRIIRSAKHLRGNIGFIIGDDSRNSRIENEYTKKGHTRNIKYFRNSPPRGPARNWNKLIDKSTSHMIWLVHHDEFLDASKKASTKLSKAISNKEKKVYILNCLLLNSDKQSSRQHTPIWLKKIILRNFPTYIFRRNIIGPCAAIIAPKHIYSKFDPNLKWLIDVDSYYKTIKEAKGNIEVINYDIYSEHNRSSSITSTLSTQIAQISQREKKYLLLKHPEAARWLDPSTINKIIWMFETAAWHFFRLVNRVVYRNPPGPSHNKPLI